MVPTGWASYRCNRRTQCWQAVNALACGGRGLDFSELRRYRPGDDIRAMDWRVTRRTGNPHVRIYAEERDRPVWLLIDQRLSMFFGSRHQMKSVAAGSAARASSLGRTGCWRPRWRLIIQ